MRCLRAWIGSSVSSVAVPHLLGVHGEILQQMPSTILAPRWTCYTTVIHIT